MTNKLNKITEKIHTINPAFTKEILDLLYEYIMTKHTINFNEISNTDNLQNILNYLINPLYYENNK